MSPWSTALITIAGGEQADVSAPPTAERASRGDLAVIAQGVLEVRRELDATATRLRELCVALCGNEPATPGTAALIEEFESQLIPHFAAEQAEELFGSLVTDQPALQQRAERLQAEHWKMAKALDHLLELARSGPAGLELAERLGRFLDWFDAHEHAENALMQDFLLLDEGGGD